MKQANKKVENSCNQDSETRKVYVKANTLTMMLMTTAATLVHRAVAKASFKKCNNRMKEKKEIYNEENATENFLADCNVLKIYGASS